MARVRPPIGLAGPLESWQPAVLQISIHMEQSRAVDPAAVLRRESPIRTLPPRPLSSVSFLITDTRGGGLMNDSTDTDQLPTPIAPGDRLLTAAEFHRLADVPPEVEWSANLDNPHTRCGSSSLRSCAGEEGSTGPSATPV